MKPFHQTIKYAHRTRAANAFQGATELPQDEVAAAGVALRESTRTILETMFAPGADPLAD